MFTKNAILLWLVLALSGCMTIREGNFVEKSHYVEPDSIVKPLGMVQAESTDFSVLVPPSFGINEAYELFDGALKQRPGADLLINYRIDNTYRVWFLPIPFIPWSTRETVIQGTAADIEIVRETGSQR